ncbi:hypothetical protein [Amycolatopsis sp. lyj-346]
MAGHLSPAGVGQGWPLLVVAAPALGLITSTSERIRFAEWRRKVHTAHP